MAFAGKLQLAASLENLPFACEFTELAFQRMILLQPHKLENGSLEVPTGPGLGVIPNKNLIEQSAVL